MVQDIKKVTMYKTPDGGIFYEKEQAIDHNNSLNKKDKENIITESIKRVFKSDLDEYYADSSMDIETKFWDDTSNDIYDTTGCSISIYNFEAYSELLKLLMKKYHAKEIIKVIEETKNTGDN